MNALLPIIEQLDDALDRPTQAEWLLAVPVHILVKYQETIINRLRNRFFAEGIAYVEAELVLLKQVRVRGLAVRENPLRLAMVALADTSTTPIEGAPGETLTWTPPAQRNAAPAPAALDI